MGQCSQRSLEKDPTAQRFPGQVLFYVDSRADINTLTFSFPSSILLRVCRTQSQQDGLRLRGLAMLPQTGMCIPLLLATVVLVDRNTAQLVKGCCGVMNRLYDRQ